MAKVCSIVDRRIGKHNQKTDSGRTTTFIEDGLQFCRPEGSETWVYADFEQSLWCDKCREITTHWDVNNKLSCCYPCGNLKEPPRDGSDFNVFSDRTREITLARRRLYEDGDGLYGDGELAWGH